VKLLETHEKEKHLSNKDSVILNGYHQQNGFAKNKEDQTTFTNNHVKNEMEEEESPIKTFKKNGFIRPKIRIVPFEQKPEVEDNKCNFSKINELKSPIKLVTEIVVLRTPNGITLQQKTSDADLFFSQTDLAVNKDSQFEVPETENFKVNGNCVIQKTLSTRQTKNTNSQSEDDESSGELKNNLEKRNGECVNKGSQNTFSYQEEDESTAIVPFTSLRSKSVSKSSSSSKNEILDEKENTSINVDSNSRSYQHCRDVIEDMLTAIVKMERWKKKKEEQKKIDFNDDNKTDGAVSVEPDTQLVVKVKGKRGRKKKIVNLEDQKGNSKELKSELSTTVPVEVKVPKKRGRKRKYPLPEDTSSTQTSELTTSDGSNKVWGSGEPKKRKSLAELLLTDLSYQWGEDDFEGAEIIFENPEEQTKESSTNDCEEDSSSETFCRPCNFKPMSSNDLRNHVMMKHTYKRDKQSLNLEKEQDWMVSEIDYNNLSCSICDIKVLNLVELSEHFKDKHTSVKQENDYLCQKKRWKVPKSRIKTCAVCGYDAKSSFLLQRHARQVHNIRINPSSKQQHQLPNGNEPITSGEIPRCIPCNRTFTRGQDLVRHKLFAHTNMKQIICEFCSKRFWRQDSFKIHIDTVHPGSTPTNTTSSYQTPIEDKKPETETYEDSIMSQDIRLVDQHFLSHNKKFNCNQCGRKYQQKYLLEKHIRFVHPHSSFKKTDKGIFGIQKVKKFICRYKHCGKMFSNLKKLRFHESDVHLASKGMKIQKDFMEVKTKKNFYDFDKISPKIAMQDDPMISTKITHNGPMILTNSPEDSLIRPRPHKCSKCWKSYTRRHHLKRHMISSHGQKAEDFEDERLKSSVFYQHLPEGVSDVIADFTVKEFDR